MRPHYPQAAAAQPDVPEPHVAILLGLHNGGRWIRAQLDSIARQSHTNWSLIVSDDGSVDDGPAVTERFRRSAAPGTVHGCAGPKRGFVRNYLSMLGRVPRDVGVVAFCDQDDVWLTDRLTRACTALNSGPQDVPALYLSTTLIAGPDLSLRGTSRPVRRRPCFANALVQCIGGGNTMAVNRAGLALLRAAAPEALLATGGYGPASHDWWMYQMITGAGGRVIADPDPSLMYRQHGGNLSGSNRGLRAQLGRAAQILRGDAHRMSDRNLAALLASAHRLTIANRDVLNRFAAARALPPPMRLQAIARLGLHRQSRAGTVALMLAAALGRV
ncbi:MAG: glycosyltransferase [Rhodobacteraceae bacterium]|nr:glycosyltransferase [Paracoccaceae bacterium]